MRDDCESHVSGAELLATEVFASKNANVDGVLANGRPPAAVAIVVVHVGIAHKRVRIVVLNDRDRRECL